MYKSRVKDLLLLPQISKSPETREGKKKKDSWKVRRLVKVKLGSSSWVCLVLPKDHANFPSLSFSVPMTSALR